MTLPLTGPLVTSQYLPGRPNYSGGYPPELYVYRRWYRQGKPYTEPSPFSFRKRWVSERTVLGTYDNSPGLNYRPLQQDNGEYTYARNKAYSKFVDKMNNPSQWATSLLEGRKTLATAVLRIQQLTRFTRKLRRLDFYVAARELELKKPPRAVSRRHQMSNNWLEYHFGWEPLVKDIGAGMEALSRDFSPKRIEERGKSRAVSNSFYRLGSNLELTRLDIETGVKIGADVRVVNPNVSLLSDLGFINPASVLWEAVPFSFVVDWFANVGQILSSATDFVGKEVTRSYTTSFQRQTWHGTFAGVVPGAINPPESGPWSVSYGLTAVYVDRSLGITGPQLTIRPFKGFSVIRGATAVALLNNLLKR